MNWGEFQPLLTPSVLLPWLLGMVFGIFVGAMPGLTATMAVALIVPISFQLQPDAGLSMIIGVSFTAIFAGDIPATLLRIPGTPASAAATLDGYAMGRKGHADYALKLDLLCSASGGLFGIILLITLAPQLARFALLFSHYEYFWLAVCGLAVSALVSMGSTFKGMLAATLGMLIATVGRDIVSGTPRYSFGVENLESGIAFIPAMIGLFGLSEVLRGFSEPTSGTDSTAIAARTPWSRAGLAVWRNKWTVLKSAFLGTCIGALPGAGADIAAWAAYGLAQKTSSRPEDFGTGCEEGVIAPTSANNAAIGGAWIPALVFGIPGDAVTAIVLGALIMYDLHARAVDFPKEAGGNARALRDRDHHPGTFAAGRLARHQVVQPPNAVSPRLHSRRRSRLFRCGRLCPPEQFIRHLGDARLRSGRLVSGAPKSAPGAVDPRNDSLPNDRTEPA